MELIRLLLEDIIRELKNNKIKKMKLQFPESSFGMTIESLKEENINKIDKDRDKEKSQPVTKTSDDNKVDVNMEDYLNSLEFQMDLEEHEKQEFFDSTLSVVEGLCKNYSDINMKCRAESPLIYIMTDGGSWYFIPMPNKDTITLYHKNYLYRMGVNTSYHLQWEKEITINQLVKEIYEHDKRKIKREQVKSP